MKFVTWQLISHAGDVKVFNPYAPRNHLTNPKRIYRKQIPRGFTENMHESAKKCSYEARICEVEHGSLILSATGRMANKACAFYKHLASFLCEKWSEPLIEWLRCYLSFSRLHSVWEVLDILLAPLLDLSWQALGAGSRRNRIELFNLVIFVVCVISYCYY